MDPLVEIFSSCTQDLLHSKTFDEITIVCRNIDNLKLDLFAKHTPNETFYTLNPAATDLTLALVRSFKTSKVLSFHMKIMKAIMKPALCMNFVYVESLFDEYSRNTNQLGAECLRIYAWLQNHKHCATVNVFLPDERCSNNLQIYESFVQASLRYSSDTRYFALAIENYILAYDTKILIKNEPFLFTVILTNLENLHQNAHKLLLELFKRVLRSYDPKVDDRIINDVFELPWTNRNKYPLLAHIISINYELLLTHPKFRMPIFLDGLQVGLTMHHLLAPSQSLVKVLQSKGAFKFQFLEMLAKLLWNGEDSIVKNAIKYWLSTLEIPLIEHVYNLLSQDGKLSDIPTTSEKFFRVLLLRNAFKRIFKDPELDSRIRDFSCEFEEMPTKIEVFYVLMENVHAETDQLQRLENILVLLQFLRFNISIADSGFVERHVMRKFPDFLNLLASRKMRNAKVLKEIFAVIRNDIYQHGFRLGSYESVMFSIRLLRIVLKQYFGGEGSRLSKNTNVEMNSSFGKYLKDNDIWDVMSPSNFKHLVKLMDQDENSDVSEAACRILVEYFIRKPLIDDVIIEGMKFTEWIDKKVENVFNQSEISSTSGASRHFIVKFEHSLNQEFAVFDLLSTVDLLKTRFTTLVKDFDVVQTMEQGQHLFRLLDCINYGLKRLSASEVKTKFIPVLNVLLKLITSHFLDYICDPGIPPSFEILDQKLTNLIESSKCTVKDHAKFKLKLTMFIWYTLRSLSELSDSLASITSTSSSPSQKEYVQTMSACLEININILSKCCHKGIIDSASAIGKITKIISKEFSNLSLRTSDAGKNLHGLLVVLKQEIDCGKRPSDNIRSSRGLIVMAHEIIVNHPPFLRFLMETLLIVPTKFYSFFDTQKIQFCDKIKPIQLHLLASLVKHGDLVEEMLKYYDFILVATFRAYKKSKDFVMNNALLQLIGAIVPKISNQKPHVMLEDDEILSHYVPKAVTVYEFYVKFSYAFRTALFDLDFEKKSLTTTYIIILLEIFSNFEYRNPGEYCSEIDKMRDVFRRLLNHECEKVRKLAAKCYAQWIAVDGDMLIEINNRIGDLFSDDINCIYSTLHCLRYMIQRYENSLKFIDDFDVAVLKSSLRHQISKKFEKEKFNHFNNFYIRYHFLEFLLFTGFSTDHECVKCLLIEKSLKSRLGYKLWKEKLCQLQMK